MSSSQPPQNRPKLSAEKARELADYLRGTCHTVEEAMNICCITGVDADEAEAAMADQEIFRCEQCSWWCDVDESNESDNGEVCNDCKES